MIQKVGYPSAVSPKIKLKSVNFGQSTVVTAPQKDNSPPIGTKPEAQKGFGVLPAILMVGGSAVVGVLGHKIFVSSKAEKVAEQVANNATSEVLFSVKVKDFEKTSLHAKFVESKKSLLGFIQEAQEKPEEMKEFLLGVTSHAQKSEEFVKEVIADPRKSRTITQTLVQKVGGQKNFVDWYFAPQGYQRAYKKWMKEFFVKAKKPEDLFKLSPNWQYHKMVAKFGKDFTAGELPKGFGTVEAFRGVAAKILRDKDAQLPQGIKKIKDFESGLSDKRVFLIEADGKQYVLKIHHDYEEYSPRLKKVNNALLSSEKTSWLGEDYFDKIHENQHMKSDSAFLNAQIDMYLNTNNCPNAPRIHFFDSKTKSSLYEVVEGESISIAEAQILDVNRKMSDLTDLGIIYNDINNNNFRVKEGKMKTIDSGESSYLDVLRPGCSDYHFKLPNWNGMDLSTCLAGINLDKI